MSRRIIYIALLIVALVLASIYPVFAVQNSHLSSGLLNPTTKVNLNQLPEGKTIQDVKDSLVLTNLKAVPAGKNKVTLSWDVVPGAEGYIIYAKRPGESAFSYLSMTTKGLTFTDSAALDSDYNFYRVYPYVMYNGSRITGTCPKYVYAKGITLAPTGITAHGAGKGIVQLSWNAVDGADGYLVYGRHSKNGEYGYITMTTGATTARDTKALDNDYNFYWVFAYHFDASGKRVVGSTPQYVYAKGVLPAITKPGLKAEGIPGGVKISWSSVKDADGYIIYAKRPGDSAFSYLSMTTKNLYYSDYTASLKDYTFYRVFPFHKDEQGNRIIGASGDYVYAKARGTVGDNIPATAISLPAELTLELGKQLRLGATLTPVNSNSQITWKSWDESILTVDANGIVTGVKSGEAFVTATIPNVKDAAKVKIRVEVPATDISVSLTTDPAMPISQFRMCVGDKRQLKAILEPSNASSKVTWKSGNESLFTVDQYGVVTGISPGEDYVTATTNGLSARVHVRVDIKAESVSLAEEIKVNIDDGSVKLNAELTPSNATSQIEWKSFNEDVVTIDSNGLATIKDGGVAYVTAMVDGKSATCVIKVGGWKHSNGKTYYYNPDTGYMKKGQQVIDGVKYYFDLDTGEMKTGFVTLSGSSGEFTYYYLPDGGIAEGFMDIDGEKYYFDTPSGVRAQGMRVINQQKYYFDPQTGVMQTGFHTVELSNGTYTFYFLPEGDVAKDMQEIEGKTYYFGNDGALQKDKLIVIDGKRHYFTADTGELAVGVYKANNDYTYYFDPEMDAGVRYGIQEYEGEVYLFHQSSGYALSRYQSVGSILYYFDENTYKMRVDNTWDYAGIRFSADGQGVVSMTVLDESNERSVILYWALSHIGVPYGADEGQLVCSSFAAEAYRQAGFTGLGAEETSNGIRYTMESFEQAIFALDNAIVYDSIDSIQPGDVIFWNQEKCQDGSVPESCEHRFTHGGVNYHVHHICIYLGNGQVVEEAESVGCSLVQNMLIANDDFYVAFYADILGAHTIP